MTRKGALDKAHAALRAHALDLPGAWEDFPWGEAVVKVGKKIFVFLGRKDDDGLAVTCKLPLSADGALEMPGVTRTGYGLGDRGWVTARVEAGARPETELWRAWIDESYRAIAPKKLVKQLDGTPERETPPAKARRRRR